MAIKPGEVQPPILPVIPGASASAPGVGELASAETGVGIPVDRGETAIVTIIHGGTTAVSLQINLRIKVIPPGRQLHQPQPGGVPQSGRTRVDEYQVITRTVTPATEDTTTLTIPLFKGYLQSAYVAVTSGSPGSGEVFCEIGVANGLQTRVNQFVSLISGFVTSQQALSNEITTQNLLTGQGALVSWQASGSATATITQTVPTNVRWRLRWIMLTLTTSAVAGTRVPRIRLTRSAVVLLDLPTRVGQALSLTYEHIFADGISQDTSVQTITAGTDEVVRNTIPDIQSVDSDVFSIVFTGNQAGDTQTVRSQFEQWVAT